MPTGTARRMRRAGARSGGAATRGRAAHEGRRISARPSYRERRALPVTAGATLAAELAQAARMVSRVSGGKSLSEQFEDYPGVAHTSRGALIDLTHGTLRRYGRVQAIVQELSARGRADERVQALLWC